MNTSDIILRVVRSEINNSIEENDMFGKNVSMYIKVSNNNDYADIPLIAAGDAEFCKVQHNAIYLPILISNYYYPLKSAITLTNQMSKIRTQELLKMTIGNYSYYVGHGLILYDDFSPMLSYIVRGKKGTTRFWQPSEETDKLILKVNSSIYSLDDPVSKFVKNQLIPKSATLNSIYFGTTNNTFGRVYILICDKEDILTIFKPKIPTNENNILDMNEFLKRNIDKICDEWQ